MIGCQSESPASPMRHCSSVIAELPPMVLSRVHAVPRANTGLGRAGRVSPSLCQCLISKSQHTWKTNKGDARSLAMAPAMAAAPRAPAMASQTATLTARVMVTAVVTATPVGPTVPAAAVTLAAAATAAGTAKANEGGSGTDARKGGGDKTEGLEEDDDEDDAGDEDDAYAPYGGDICARSAEADEESARITAARACAGASLSPQLPCGHVSPPLPHGPQPVGPVRIYYFIG